MKICIVSLNAYDLLARRAVPRHCGGIERQQELLARGLVRRGHEVSFVTWDWGQGEVEVHDGITAYKTCSPKAGIAGLRFFIPRWSALRRALAMADADIYYQQSADSLTGQVGGWARSHGRQFIFMAASNFDCDPTLPNLTSRREKFLFKRGLRKASCCIAQTRHQQEMFLRHFGCNPVVLPNIGPPTNGLPDHTHRNRNSLLWVGRIDPVKRLDVLLDLAERCPELCFQVVGGANQESEYAAQLARRAQAAPNVVFHGRLGRVDLDRLYRETGALICTSSLEGFPNTFLEAWSVGLPVITTFDPDDIISTNGLGVAVPQTSALSAQLACFLAADHVYPECSRRCHAYFLAHYTTEAVIAAHENLWTDACKCTD